MNSKRIAILGSTGSIGRAALDVIRRHSDRFSVVALAAHSNAELLLEQFRRFRPQYVCLVDKASAGKLSGMLKQEPVEVVTGDDGLIALAALDGIDLVLNSVVGAAGLRVSLETVKRGKDLALANKESLVAGGPLFPPLIKKTGARLLPVDSEHSAIWQALRSGKPKEVKAIILTASGGPFRDYPMEKLKQVTVEQALAHPTWKMGPKITIDSATMVNKGLEVMEAVVLFSVEPAKIKVVIHPQSVIHSMVEFVDSSVIAQLSIPDMRLPISYALFWPDRTESDFGCLDWTRLDTLTFEQPDFDKFPALGLAYEAASAGGTAPAVYNAANEVVVQAFLDGDIAFTGITDMIKATMDKIEIVDRPELDDILRADTRAREVCRQNMEKTVC
jgi:1-deoxy-D-xylulose-5-phosphate reductoisomerase